MTLSELSLRNARRQARDYLVYFVTIVIAAALIYAFNGLVFSGEVRGLSQMMKTLPLVIAMASVVVVCVFGWLVSYSTRFMLSKRSREMARALRNQFAIYYAMPAIPPILIAVPFTVHLARVPEPGVMIGMSSHAAIVTISLGLFFLFYSVYILLAYTSLKRNVLPD